MRVKDGRRPLGPVVHSDAAKVPEQDRTEGRFVRLERLDQSASSLEDLGAAIWHHIKDHPFVWDYLYETPPTDEAAFIATLRASCAKSGWHGYAVCLPKDGPVGYAFYLNTVPDMGSIEVGNINFSPRLQRTPAATEAIYLLMRMAFGLGYRRLEWKCNALNMPSRRAAQRFGFSWEGIFRQHLIVKGRNRDTAWLAMTDQDWPALKTAFQTWLAPANFDADGQQRQSLSRLTAPVRSAGDPDL